MKIATGGRFLWMRTIGSTIVGQGVDSLIVATGVETKGTDLGLEIAARAK